MYLWLRPATNRKSIHAFGKTETLTNAMAECAELIQAIEKIRKAYRNGEDTTEHREHLVEEMADVMIIIVNLMEIYGIDRKELNRWLNVKQSRQEHRIREKENEADTYYPG